LEVTVKNFQHLKIADITSIGYLLFSTNHLQTQKELLLLKQNFFDKLKDTVLMEDFDK